MEAQDQGREQTGVELSLEWRCSVLGMVAWETVREEAVRWRLEEAWGGLSLGPGWEQSSDP